MPSDIRITAEPVDAQRCKFLVDRPVYQGVRRFAGRAEAAGSPLAEALFALPGVRELIVSGNLVTVVKESPEAWQVAGKAVGAAIRQALSGDAPAIADRPAATGAARVSDDELYERVNDLFEQQVNPMVARHGGRVELIDVQESIVLLRMSGGCQGCGMASVTLRQGIEGILNQHLPEVKGIVDITDHTSGSNPYFASAKK
ncbi:MAG TPA: NifU family protein [Gemmatimonadales bacterium]|jgi:Fe-S cluster biogenesis protein NfuA